ncbi:MAG: ankyrin repeat domain-containing protein [Chloroflexota bacterium]
MILAYGGGEGLKYPLQLRNRPSIHGAVSFNHPEMTQWFLEHGADLTARDYNDQTPLEAAVELGHNELADLLRNHIGEHNLAHCSNCGKSGYRIVAKREGNRWTMHTAYYKCHLCGNEMGSEEYVN